jgi:hypothetical protein
METLAITKTHRNEYMLKDARGAHISTSSNLDSLVQFCKDSGYRVYIEEGGKIRWLHEACRAGVRA